MSDVYDLTGIDQLVRDKRPDAIVVVDTNILMYEPDFNKWKTPLNKTLFVLPPEINLELAHLKNKSKPDGVKAARRAIQGLYELNARGKIFNGIHLEDVGWFISVPSPTEDGIQQELAQYEPTVKALGPVDAKVMILVKELSQFVASVPVILVTGDKIFYNHVSMQGLLAYPYERFPLDKLGKLVEKRVDVDLDKVLADIARNVEKNSIEVKLTLTSKSIVPRWVAQTSDLKPESRARVAEGSGIISNYLKGRIVFRWTLSFYEWPNDENPAEAHLDFEGADDILPSRLRERLSEKIEACASPFALVDGLPTVQDAKDVLLAVIVYDYGRLQELLGEALDEAMQNFNEEIESCGGIEKIEKFATPWFLHRHLDEDDMFNSMREFLIAMKSCWKLGDSIEIRVIDDSEQSE